MVPTETFAAAPFCSIETPAYGVLFATSNKQVYYEDRNGKYVRYYILSLERMM